MEKVEWVVDIFGRYVKNIEKEEIVWMISNNF